MFYGDLSGVIVRICNIRSEAVVLTERWPQFVSRPIKNNPIGASVDLLFAVRFALRAAGRDISESAEAQAKRLVPRVCIILRNEAMPLRPYVGQGEHRRPRQLSLQRQIVVLRVRQPFVDV